MLRIALCVAFLCVSCAPPAPLDGARCDEADCLHGWHCCALDKMCVPDGEMCSPREQTDEVGMIWGYVMSFKACAGSIDENGDEIIDTTWTTERDGNRVTKLLDRGNDGSIDEKVSAEFTPDGYPLHWVWSDIDDVPKISLDFSYDDMMRSSSFQMIVHESLPIFDVVGIKSFRATFIYEHGVVVREFDMGLDGADHRGFIQQDDRGRPTRVDYDYPDAHGNFDGVFDGYFEHVYDERGVTEVHERLPGKPPVDTSYSYDDAGNVIRIDQDRNGDGDPDLGLRKTYDPEHNVLSREYWNKQLKSQVLRYQYDCR
jgi:hypothetical protein